MLTWRGFHLGPQGTLRADETVDGPVFAVRSDAETQSTTSAEGTRDADSACFLAGIAGLGSKTVLYLDIDDGCTADYFSAWVEGVQERGFIPGVTGNPAAVVLLGQRGIDLGHWVFRAIYQDPAHVEREGVEQWVH